VIGVYKGGATWSTKLKLERGRVCLSKSATERRQRGRCPPSPGRERHPEVTRRTDTLAQTKSLNSRTKHLEREKVERVEAGGEDGQRPAEPGPKRSGSAAAAVGGPTRDARSGWTHNE